MTLLRMLVKDFRVFNRTAMSPSYRVRAGEGIDVFITGKLFAGRAVATWSREHPAA
jgi:hypothetical protein